jgi:hypothetical protein
MFGSARIRTNSPIEEDTMTQQLSSSRLPMVPSAEGSEQCAWLNAESSGRDRFRVLLQQWLKRNQWSLAVVSRLAELSLLASAKVPVPDWSAGMGLDDGALVNHRGHAWRAVGRPLSEPTEGDAGWHELGLTSRLHASGLNLFLRNRTRNLTCSFLLELGRLNLWVADVQAGRSSAPADRRLRDLVKGATLLSDEQGALGPEELLGIAVGRLDPPPWPGQLATGAQAIGSVPARQLRAAAAAAGLDIVDDWETIASLYPSSDPARLGQLQQVLRGTSQWSDQEEDDERAACLVLLQRLKNQGAQGDEQEAAADTVIPAVVTELSPGAR